MSNVTFARGGGMKAKAGAKGGKPGVVESVVGAVTGGGSPMNGTVNGKRGFQPGNTYGSRHGGKGTTAVQAASRKHRSAQAMAAKHLARHSKATASTGARAPIPATARQAIRDAAAASRELQAAKAEAAYGRSKAAMESRALASGRAVSLAPEAKAAHVAGADKAAAKAGKFAAKATPPASKPAATTPTPVAATHAGGEHAGKASFVTSKGSTYEFDGRTTQRTKSLHEHHDPKDVGVKERSSHTVFVSPEFAREVGMWQTSSASHKRLVVAGDKVHLLSWNHAQNKHGLDRTISDNSFASSPKVGAAPLELWKPDATQHGWRKPGMDVYSGSHPGNEIVKIDHHAAPAAPAHSPAPTPMQARVKASAKEAAGVKADRATQHLGDLHAGAKAGAFKDHDEIHGHVDRIAKGATKADLFAAARKAGLDTQGIKTKGDLVQHIKNEARKTHIAATNKAKPAEKSAEKPAEARPHEAPKPEPARPTPKAEPAAKPHAPKPQKSATPPEREVMHRIEKAFDKHAKDNHLTIDKLRAEVPEATLADFHEAMRQHVREGRFTLDTHDGLMKAMTPAMREAALPGTLTRDGVHERLVHVSRRAGAEPTAPPPAATPRATPKPASPFERVDAAAASPAVHVSRPIFGISEPMHSVEHQGVRYHFSATQEGRNLAASALHHLETREPIPAHIAAHTKDVHITAEDYADSHKVAAKLGSDFAGAKVRGFAHKGDIALYGRTYGAAEHERLAHEMSHNYARHIYGSVEPLPGSDFARARAGNEAPYSAYGATSATEDFATSFGAYHADRAAFAKSHPERFKVIDRIHKDPKYGG